MPTSLLDLPDDLLRMVAEEIRTSNKPYVHLQTDLRHFSSVNQQIRTAALPVLWSHLQLPWEGHPNSSIKVLSLDPSLWSHVRFLEIAGNSLGTSGGSTSAAMALTLAKHIRTVRIHSEDLPEPQLPTVVTNALRYSRIQKLQFWRLSTTFEDPTFRFENIKALREVDLWSLSISPSFLIDGGPTLKSLTFTDFDGDSVGKMLLWSIRKVVELELYVLHPARTTEVWTLALLEQLRQAVAAPVSPFSCSNFTVSEIPVKVTQELQPTQLAHLTFDGVYGFFHDSTDPTATTSESIFDTLSQLSLDSLTVQSYGPFHWTAVLARVQLPTVTKLTLSAPQSDVSEDATSATDQVC
ncbi:hypothetical protein P7C70_g7429, partial [Phenoliferia sp. Uapishka_3]